MTLLYIKGVYCVFSRSFSVQVWSGAIQLAKYLIVMATKVQWFLIFTVYVVQISKCSSIQDAELIPGEMHTAGSEYLGKSLPLDVRNSPHLVRNNVVRYRGVPRQRIPLEDSAYASSDVIDHGYQGVAGETYDDQQKGSEFYGKEASGQSRGEVGFYGRQGKKGSNQRVTDDGYRDNERSIHDNRSDAGFHDDSSGAKQSHDIAKEQKAAQNYAQNGQGVERYNNKGGHRKGHHKSGFTNSYHKDETGNKSDFFDDSVDEGDHYVFNNQGGFFNDQGSNKQHNNYQDGAFKNNNQGRQGHFDEGQNYNDRSGEKGKYSRDRYSDDKLDYGQQKSGETFGQKSHGAEERGGAKYYDNNGQVYQQRRAPLPYIAPLAPPIVTPAAQTYYPVEEPVDRYYAPAVESGQFYPLPSDYYPSKTAPYARQVNGPGVAASQYYLPRSEVYYPTSAY